MGFVGFMGVFVCFCFKVETCSTCRIILRSLLLLSLSCLSVLFFVVTVTYFSSLCFLVLFHLQCKGDTMLASDGGEKSAPAVACPRSRHSVAGHLVSSVEMLHQHFVGWGMLAPER